MGRILAFLLGGLALALFAPNFFMTGDQLQDYMQWWTDHLGKGWKDKLFTHGPGVFAGLALLLFAVRGREGSGPG